MTREKIKRAYIQYKNKPLYVLGASAYASYDFKLCGFDDKKCFKWGYFPQIEEKNIDDIIKAKRVNDRIKILYAGRLIKLKRVIDFVKAVNLIVKQGVVNFKFTIIGDGEEKNKIIKYINTNELSEFVEVFPFKPANEVRKEMDLADIYVFGSDFNEGWGAVVNEAMNSACAMVVSHAVGSAPYLIKNEQSGCIYRCGDVKQIKKIILKLLQQTEYRENLSKNAYETVLNHWSAKVAVDRFVEVCSKIEQKEYPYFQDGVCSYAELLKNNWIKKEK